MAARSHFQSFGQCAKICLDRTFNGMSVSSRDLEYRLPFLFVPTPDGAASRESGALAATLPAPTAVSRF
jgi:hypothetical protein